MGEERQADTKCANPSWEEPASYESYVAVVETLGQNADPDWNDEFKPTNGEIETEEFKYLIGERVA